MKQTPFIVKVYFLLAAFLFALPTLGTKFYTGQTGRFLVASEYLRYEPFRESVIYISRHNIFGAFGYVINKPLSREQLKAIIENPPDDISNIYLGGPVQYKEKIYTVFANLIHEPIDEREAEDTLTLLNVQEHIKHYPHKRIYLGYTGWGPLQLEMEIIRGSWSIIEHPKDIIFDNSDTVDIWRALKDKVTPDRYEDQKI